MLFRVLYKSYLGDKERLSTWPYKALRRQHDIAVKYLQAKYAEHCIPQATK